MLIVIKPLHVTMYKNFIYKNCTTTWHRWMSWRDVPTWSRFIYWTEMWTLTWSTDAQLGVSLATLAGQTHFFNVRECHHPYKCESKNGASWYSSFWIVRTKDCNCALESWTVCPTEPDTMWNRSLKLLRKMPNIITKSIKRVVHLSSHEQREVETIVNRATKTNLNHMEKIRTPSPATRKWSSAFKISRCLF
jgi:hypothetical protein